MSTLQWAGSPRSGNPITIFSATDLASIANGGTVLSAVIENSTSRDLYADLMLTLTLAATPTVNMPVELFVVRSIDDGTTFEDTTSGAPPTQAVGDQFPVRATTSAQNLLIPQLEVPPQAFKFLLRNSAGVAFAASGSILKGYFYKRAVV